MDFPHGISAVGRGAFREPVLLMGAPWESWHKAICQKGQIRGVVVSQRGVRMPFRSLNFARLIIDLPDLKYMEILLDEPCDLPDVSGLMELETLVLSAKTARVTGSAPAALARLDIAFPSNILTVWNMQSLKEIRAERFPERTLKGLASSIGRKVTTVSISRAPKLNSLHGLEGLQLVRLSVYGAPNLDDIESLAGVDTLKKVEFETCRLLKRWGSLGDCTSLEEVHIIKCGAVDNLEWIQRLRKLKVITIGGTRLLSGDLSPLSELNPSTKQYIRFPGVRQAKTPRTRREAR